jgi:hypothetical protein
MYFGPRLLCRFAGCAIDGHASRLPEFSSILFPKGAHHEESQSSGARIFFVDESGDPAFCNRDGKYIVREFGCSPILILGFIADAVSRTAVRLKFGQRRPGVIPVADPPRNSAIARL